MKWWFIFILRPFDRLKMLRAGREAARHSDHGQNKKCCGTTLRHGRLRACSKKSHCRICEDIVRGAESPGEGPQRWESSQDRRKVCSKPSSAARAMAVLETVSGDVDVDFAEV